MSAENLDDDYEKTDNGEPHVEPELPIAETLKLGSQFTSYTDFLLSLKVWSPASNLERVR